MKSNRMLAATLLLTCGSFSLPAISAADAETQLFVQSVMYRPLADWCEPKLASGQLPEAFRDWYRSNKPTILLGAKQVAQQAEQTGKSMEQMLDSLIHIQEVEFGGLQPAQQLEKCEKLREFLARK